MQLGPTYLSKYYSFPYATDSPQKLLLKIFILQFRDFNLFFGFREPFHLPNQF